MEFQKRYRYDPKRDLLGKGGFARVYKAYDTRLKRQVALKIYKADEQGSGSVVEEISRAIQLEHLNLCRYYDAEVIERENSFGETESIEIGVMEYMEGGDLQNYFRHVSSDVLRLKMLSDVLQGLAYLHKQGIVHRDLKPQNILIKETAEGPVAKITDFGISKKLQQRQTVMQSKASSALMGTMVYMAPEQISPEEYGINGRISTNVDLWSFGVMVYELVSGEEFVSGDSGRVIRTILTADLQPKIDQLPEPYRRVVGRCLVRQAAKRVQKAEDLLALLKETEPKKYPVGNYAWRSFDSHPKPTTEFSRQNHVLNTKNLFSASQTAKIIKYKFNKIQKILIFCTLPFLLLPLHYTVTFAPLVFLIFSYLLGLCYANLMLRGKDQISVAGEVLPAKQFLIDAVALTVLTVISTGALVRVGKYTQEYIMWGCYEEWTMLGLTMLIIALYLISIIPFLIGVAKPVTFNFPNRRAFFIFGIYYFLAPLLLVVLLSSTTHLIAGPLRGSCM